MTTITRRWLVVVQEKHKAIRKKHASSFPAPSLGGVQVLLKQLEASGVFCLRFWVLLEEIWVDALVQRAKLGFEGWCVGGGSMHRALSQKSALLEN